MSAENPSQHCGSAAPPQAKPMSAQMEELREKVALLETQVAKLQEGMADPAWGTLRCAECASNKGLRFRCVDDNTNLCAACFGKDQKHTGHVIVPHKTSENVAHVRIMQPRAPGFSRTLGANSHLGVPALATDRSTIRPMNAFVNDNDNDDIY